MSTCHDRSNEEKDTEENVACQRAIFINDLSLADGKDDPKHLW